MKGGVYGELVFRRGLLVLFYLYLTTVLLSQLDEQLRLPTVECWKPDKQDNFEQLQACKFAPV